VFGCALTADQRIARSSQMRGVKQGNPNGNERLLRAGKSGAALRAAVSADAARSAANLEAVIEDIDAGRTHSSGRLRWNLRCTGSVPGEVGSARWGLLAGCLNARSWSGP
jgi:hypothetical protein